MPLTVKFIGALRYSYGKPQITINFQTGISLKGILQKISEESPELKQAFDKHELDDTNANSLILVNGREISVLDGYETKLNDGDEIVFIPVVHGG